MIIASVTDEIDPDPVIALQIGIDSGIRHFELRKAYDSRFPHYADDTFDLLVRWRDEYELEYTAVSPGLFKVEETGPRSTLFGRARELGVERVILFAPHRGVDYEEAVVSVRDFCAEADTYNFTVLVENSANTMCGSAGDTATLIRDTGVENLLANWDPANAVSAGFPDNPEEYEKVRPYVGGVHIKDLVSDPDGTFRYVSAGTGLIDYPRLIEALGKDGYSGSLTIETHCHPPQRSFVESLAYLKRLIGAE